MYSQLLSFGEILWDVYPESKHLGGAPLNFAAHFVQCGGSAGMVSALGNDSYGSEALEIIKNLNINTDYIGINPERETGKCLVQLNENKIPEYNLIEGTAYDFIKAPEAAAPCEVIYFGSLALRSEYNLKSLEALLGRHRGDVFVDINIRPPFYSEKAIDFCLAHASFLKVSDEELPTVSKTVFGKALSEEEFCAQASERCKNIKIIIVTKGGDGAIAYEKNKFFRTPAVKTDVVSTVGAGDSFGAAFLYHYLKHGDIREAMLAAGRVSAFVVSCKEAIPKYDKIDL